MSKGKSSPGGRGSRKHGRNFRRNGLTGSMTTYMASGGPARAAARKAKRIAHQQALRGRVASTDLA